MAVAMLLSLCVTTSMAVDSPAAAYPVYVHGGTLQKDGMTVRSGAEFPAGTVLTVTLDESRFSDHTFAYWVGSDGTQVPQKSFRMVVDRVTGFYPAFSDLTGNFGDWTVLIKGKFCTDGTLYVREDSAQGLKEYRFESGYHNTYTYEPLNDEQHTIRCADCSYERKLRQLNAAGALFRVNHKSWWKEELPSVDGCETARKTLNQAGWDVDYIITHCCPSNIQNIFSGGRYQRDALTDFFDEVRERCRFKYWFFGHYHENMVVEKKFVMLYEQIIRLK